MTTIDISKNSELFYFKCCFNQITTLYSLKDTWQAEYYVFQYLDVDHTMDADAGLEITICSPTITDTTDITNRFTDVNFRTEVYKLIGKTSPSPILYSDVKNLKTLYVIDKNISSLRGIEYFSSLTTLNCDKNKITNLDVSKNTALIELECYRNQLITLDVSNLSSTNFLKKSIKNPIKMFYYSK